MENVNVSGNKRLISVNIPAKEPNIRVLRTMLWKDMFLDGTFEILLSSFFVLHYDNTYTSRCMYSK